MTGAGDKLVGVRVVHLYGQPATCCLPFTIAPQAPLCNVRILQVFPLKDTKQQATPSTEVCERSYAVALAIAERLHMTTPALIGAHGKDGQHTRRGRLVRVKPSTTFREESAVDQLCVSFIQGHCCVP